MDSPGSFLVAAWSLQEPRAWIRLSQRCLFGSRCQNSSIPLFPAFLHFSARSSCFAAACSFPARQITCITWLFVPRLGSKPGPSLGLFLSWLSDHAGLTSLTPTRSLLAWCQHDACRFLCSWMSTCGGCFVQKFHVGPWHDCSACFARTPGLQPCPGAFATSCASFRFGVGRFVVRSVPLLQPSSTCSAPPLLHAFGNLGSESKPSMTHPPGIRLLTTWSSCTASEMAFSQQCSAACIRWC